MNIKALTPLYILNIALGSLVSIFINGQFSAQPTPKSKNMKANKQQAETNATEITKLLAKRSEIESPEIEDCPNDVIQSDEKINACNKSVAWVLKNRRIFFISTSQNFDVELPACEAANASTIQFLQQIGEMLHCSVEDPDPIFFPAHYSFNHQTLTDVYVSVQKRCNKPDCLDFLYYEERNKLVENMLEDYLIVMPRSHYGYDAPNEKPSNEFNQPEEPRKCLDETGYMISTPSANNYTQACFSLWMADKNKMLISGLNSEYYSGLLGFNRVEQQNFLVEGAKSIPYYFYEKNQLPCRISNSQKAQKSCSIFLSAENYGMLCCCYKQNDICHFPNPMSYHFRSLYESTKKEYTYRLTCGYGNYSYADIKKAAEGEPARVSWLKQMNQSNDIKLGSTGYRCGTVYEFTQTNFIMRMSSWNESDCKDPTSKQFLCELQDKVCPGTKPVKTSFSVKCCCGGQIEFMDNGEQRPIVEDLCNLDFLSHRVQDKFEEVFNKTLCSYSRHYHRLFGNYYKEGETEVLYCNVHYDLRLKKVVYLLDGNNIEFLYDPTHRTKRDNSMTQALIMGKLIDGIALNCSQDATYKIFRDSPQRVFYVQKCNPATDGRTCDEALEQSIGRNFKKNKDKVMKKCLKYKNQKPVSSKSDLETDMKSNSSQIHADHTFLCFAHIRSTIVEIVSASEDKKYKFMTHDIKAAVVPTNDAVQLQHLNPNDTSFKINEWCIKILENRKRNVKSDYCFSMDENHQEMEQNFGNNDATFFCCCFVGYGWEDCDLQGRIVSYVDSYDLIMDEKSILEAYQGQGECATGRPFSLNKQSKNIQESIRNEELGKCVQAFGCFQIQDLDDHKPKRFEIWAGCTSNIPRLVLLSAHMRLASLCTTNVFSEVTVDNPKCLVVDLAQYFNSGYKSDYNPPNGYPFALICCCISDCKGNAINELYGLALNNAAET